MVGAIANVTPIHETPSQEGKLLGYLHAGATVARAHEPYSREGCSEGWYPVRPRGFVCVGATATLDTEHPTMVAMSLRPDPGDPLPYTYARTTLPTTLLDRDPERADGVRASLPVPRWSGLAVVGSWSAFDSEGRRLRLGMTTRGQFIEAEALKPAEPSAFAGIALAEPERTLPFAFVVKRGVHSFKLDDENRATRSRELDYHEHVPLTGRFRTLGETRYWAAANDNWVRHDDVTIVRRRNVYPEFAKDSRKWIDISIVTGTAVLYEGQKPVFATLVSVGQDRLMDPQEGASTVQGTFQVVGKHLTSADHDPSAFIDGVLLFDVPWVVELSSGQLLHGSYSHDRFGIEHGPGNVQLSPADARSVWSWVDPELPEGWHGVLGSGDAPTLVHVRK